MTLSEANQYARIMAEELNVKEISITVGTGVTKDNRRVPITVEYHHDTIYGKDTPLDMYLDGKPQGKQELAAEMFANTLREQR